MKTKKENKRLKLYWVDKLKELQEDNPGNPLKALYLFEEWAEKEEDKFNEEWYSTRKKDIKDAVKGLEDI
ncbi:MAG: hypothetical protein ACOCRX_12240 [Candidatus Woesearchaeota archaeon]